MRPHLTLGANGERLATHHLRRAGMRILARNWRCPLGELDIVATHQGLLVFCEVKTRTSTTYGTPTEAVDTQKATRIRTLATHWRRTHGIPPTTPTRFDIISILWPPGGSPRIHHLTGAF